MTLDSENGDDKKESSAKKEPRKGNIGGFVGHLADLRRCLLRAGGAVLLIFFALFPIAGHLYEFFASPLLAALPNGSPIATGIISPFLVQLKVTLLIAFCIALPYVLFEVWRFVAPGLYTHEKRMVLPLVASSTLLFFSGMAFAYFLVFRVVFGFIASVAPESVAWMPDIEQHLSFALTVFIAFGVAFEVPVAVFLLVRTGAVEIDALRRARPYVIVGAFVVAAIFTPPDVLSQLLLAIPCWILFEIGLFISARFAPPKEKDADEE